MVYIQFYFLQGDEIVTLTIQITLYHLVAQIILFTNYLWCLFIPTQTISNCLLLMMWKVRRNICGPMVKKALQYAQDLNSQSLYQRLCSEAIELPRWASLIDQLGPMPVPICYLFPQIISTSEAHQLSQELIDRSTRSFLNVAVQFI